MFRAALCILMCSTSALAVETVRIDMGTAENETVVKGASLSFGQDGDEGAFTSLDGRSAAVRKAGERLELNGAPLVGEAIRFRTGGDGQIEAGGVRVRGEVVV